MRGAGRARHPGIREVWALVGPRAPGDGSVQESVRAWGSDARAWGGPPAHASGQSLDLMIYTSLVFSVRNRLTPGRSARIQDDSLSFRGNGIPSVRANEGDS